MSIVTLRSTEAFGIGGAVPEERAVNFQNFFKSPITFRKDDRIEVTSVTINQEITKFFIDNTNNEIQYRIGEAAAAGNVPFFTLHTATIIPGEYLPASLAQQVAQALNASLTLPIAAYLTPALLSK